MRFKGNDDWHPITNAMILEEAHRITAAFGLSYAIVVFNNARGVDADQNVKRCQACLIWNIREMRASPNDPSPSWSRISQVLRGQREKHTTLIEWHKRAVQTPEFRLVPKTGEIQRSDSQSSKQQEAAA